MTKEELKIIFMGTPHFAVATLQALVEGGYNVVAVVTQPDKPSGRRHSTLTPSPVKQYATEHNLPVMQPLKMKDEAFISELRSYAADLQVVVAFRMLPEAVWAMPRLGTFNVHASLLPRYRGAAPINWAVINGETITGVTTFFIDSKIDTGRIIKQHTCPINEDDCAGDVHDALMSLGARTAIETVDDIILTDGRTETIEQDRLLTQADTGAEPLPTAPKIFNDTCRIDWNRPARDVHNFVRGLSPLPGAWTLMTTDGKTDTLKIFSTKKTDLPANRPPGTVVIEGHNMYVATADLLVAVGQVQAAGKRRMDAALFINGMRNIATAHLQ